MQEGPGVADALLFAGTLVVAAVVLLALAGRPPARWQTARAFAFLAALALAAGAAAFLLAP